MCIVGCTLADEKAIAGEGARKLKTRQVDSVFHGLGHFIEPVHPLDYVHEQVVTAPLTYIQPSAVSYGQQPASHFVQTADHFNLHTPNVHQIYNYVPTIGYGHPFTYGVHPTGSSFQASSSVSSSSPSVNFPASSSQQASGVQATTGQTGLQSAIAQQQESSPSGIQTGNLVQQADQQTASQQSASSQNEQGTGSQESGSYQFGLLHSGFGNQQRFGIVQTPVSQPAQSQVNFRQNQGSENDQAGSSQSGFSASQQSGISSQQFTGGFVPSSAVSSVATARQDSQASQQTGSQASQQTGASPAGTLAFSSPVFGYSAGSVRLIQPYNLSPSYAIHGFRNFQSGASSAAQVSEEASSGSSQNSASGSSQQISPASGFQFDTSVGQSSGSSGSSQTSFRSGTGNSGSSGVQYSYTNQQSAAQPATVRAGGSSASSGQSSSGSSAGQASGSLSSFHSSLYRSGDASQDFSSGSVQTSGPTQAPPAILRMVNDFNNDGSFNYG